MDAKSEYTVSEKGPMNMEALYGKLTWPEIKSADKDRVVILPVGAMEDHGPHLP